MTVADQRATQKLLTAALNILKGFWSRGWGPYPVRVGAHMGPYGPILFKESLILIEIIKLLIKIEKIVNLEILKVNTWFGDKDLYS